MSRLAHIDHLPVEIIRAIFCYLKTPDLDAVTSVSDVLQAQRDEHVTALCLVNDLGDVALDAFVAYYSGKKLPGSTYIEQVTGFLALYKEARDGRTDAFPASYEALISLVRFHTTIVAPLVREYASLHLVRLEDAVLKRHSPMRFMDLGPPDREDAKTSQTEKMRITRAFYRFQVWCNLVRITGDDREFQGANPAAQIIPETFLGLFEPWEVEEINCIYYWVEHANTRAGDQAEKLVTWNVDHTSVDLLPSWVQHWQDVNVSGSWLQMCEGLAVRGLEALHRLGPLLRSFDPRGQQCVFPDPTGLSQDMSDFVSRRYTFHLGRQLDAAPQRERWAERPSLRDRKQARRDPLPFMGDDHRAPPYMWTELWGGTYSSLYGDFIGRNYLQLGYVFWDAHRVRDIGEAERYIRELWLERWAGFDVRESFGFDDDEPLGD